MRILFTFSILLFSTYLIGQVVCAPGLNGVQATDEFPGCRMCTNVYEGNTGNYTADSGVSDACGSNENSLWLSFVADNSGEFEATFLSFNCTNMQGVEMTLFDKDQNVIECFTGDGPGDITTTGLLAGEVHYLMIDGKSGDICDFTLILKKGAAAFGAPDRAGEITADQEGNLCVGAEVCYSIDAVPGATWYEWAVPTIATIIDGGGPNDLFMCARLDEFGGNVVSVTTYNDCFAGPIRTKQVVALPTVDGPDIACASTSAGLEFSWDAPAGATSYAIFINGQMATTTSNTSYTVTGLMNGAIVNIRVQAEGDCTFNSTTRTCSYTVSSVNQNFVNTQLQIIPNPTGGNVRIETELQLEEIEIFSTTGTLLSKETNTIFDLKRFGSGIYFLKIKTNEGVGVKRVLVN